MMLIGKAYRLVRHLLHDARRTATGPLFILKSALHKDLPSVNLSMFAADSPFVHPGDISLYTVTMANGTRRPDWCRLLIDVYLVDNPTHPHGHHGYFETTVLVRAGTRQQVGIGYDWNGTAMLAVDGVCLHPDGIWRGPCRRTGRYLVRAHQLNRQGQPIEELTLIQELH